MRTGAAESEKSRLTSLKDGGAGTALGEPSDDPGWKTIKYEDIDIGERIGGGGAGIVYSGRFRSKNVAIKTLFDPRVNEELRREFMNELHVMSKLSHPNIVDLLGASVQAPNLFFVMELCKTSVFEILHVRKESLSVKQRLDFAIGAANALAYLHGLDPVVIHRDIKSHNLLVTTSGRVKLCDFGLVMSQVPTAGTVNYMPPELLRGKSISRKVDVYMFGALLWELMAVEIPFFGYDVSEIKTKVLRGDRPSLDAVPPNDELKELIVNCWDEDPSLRPEFVEVIHSLRSIAAAPEPRREVDTLSSELGDSLDALMK